jgi:membrane-bound lytic murein transglycosylase B
MKLSNEDLQTKATVLNALINYESIFGSDEEMTKAIDKLSTQLCKEVNGLTL